MVSCALYTDALVPSGKPFMHVRMQENVEISNPMYLREEVDDDAEALDGNFSLDADKVGVSAGATGLAFH